MDREVWTITLNKYQRDNLLWLINVCGYPARESGNAHATKPFTLANTGDWIGEIAIKLAAGDPPFRMIVESGDLFNKDTDQLRSEIKRMTKDHEL